MKTPRFTRVFYVAQVTPIIKICGYTFTLQEAELLSETIRHVTGTAGRIIEFSREEIESYEFPR
ncbi:hypothetical protein [Chroococcidiopsis sp.]|uniref:hypothetical protein n=1 Tax=Chroococcidiopsis sp. TaxID=3088168 RepID=UPI003F32C455